MNERRAFRNPGPPFFIMDDILKQIDSILKKATESIKSSKTKADLDSAISAVLGRKGKIAEISKSMGKIDAELRLLKLFYAVYGQQRYL